MKISLITDTSRDSTLKGTIPTIQNLAYWVNNGYKYIVHTTEDAITLTKWNIGKTEERCIYPRVDW